MYECYDNIIGISQTECNCYPDKPEVVSNSELYLDELEGLESIASISGCESGNIWEVGEKAIKEAVKEFVVDSNALLLRKYKQTLKQYNGLLGWTGGKDVVNITSSYAGMVISCRNVKSGYLKIKDLGLIFDQTGAINIKIFDQYNNVIDMVDCTTIGGKKKSNVVDIVLPCVTKEYGRMTYFLVYEVGGNKPLDNKVGCNCGGGFNSTFHEDNPYYYGNWNGSHSWANWCMIGGVEFEDLESFDEDFNASNYANGISLSVDFHCDNTQTLCSDDMDFSEPINMCIALAIRYKAAEKIALKILNSTKLNRESFISKDILNERMTFWSAMYSEKMTYLVQNVDVSNNGCMGCDHKINIGKILS